MAEVIGLAVSAAQTGEYCLKLCNLVERVYYASTSMRRHQQRIQELRALLAQILRDPIFHTPEIASCTTTLSDIIQSINIPEVIRKRDRLVYSVAFVFKERHFNELFGCIEEKKSTLALYIAHVNKTILDDLRTDLKHSRLGLCNNSIGEGKDEDCKMASNREDRLVSVISSTLSHEQRAPVMFSRTGQQPAYKENQLVIHRSRLDTSTPRLPSHSLSSRSQHIPEPQPYPTSSTISSYSSNLHTGAGTQQNGPRITPAIRAKDEIFDGTKNTEYLHNYMGPADGEEKEGKIEQSLRSQMKYRQINGPVFEPGARAEKVGGNYSKNIMKRNGDQFNGPYF